MPFCANCGAYSDEPVERCPNCTPPESSLAATPVAIAPPPAIASPQGKLLAGCLALVGGILAGSTASTALFFIVAAAGEGFNAGKHGRAEALAIAVVLVGLMGIVGLAVSAKKRDAFLQIFLVTTLVTTLGVFATCSTLFWAVKG